MSRLARTVALQLMSIAASFFPPRLSSWSLAMVRELDAVPNDQAALRFALGCLRSAVTLALLDRLRAFHVLSLEQASLSVWRSQAMNHILRHPRLMGLLCAAGAVGLGLVYLSMAEAPSRYLLMNLAALILGATLWFGITPAAAERLSRNGRAVFALSLPLLATAMFGIAADGAARWVSVGPLAIQTSLILLPLMIVLYARRVDAIGTAGMAVAAIALAIQPDRAMAGVLVVGLAAIVFTSPGRLPALALTLATGAFATTLFAPDLAPASPFVDQILHTAFDVHMLAGIVVVAGSSLLLTPAIFANREPDHTPVMLAFGASWAGIVAAAALGNYPTPLVGYSGSAILGYLLSVSFLPGKRVDHLTVEDMRTPEVESPEDHTTRLVEATVRS